jgi:hypothetical protein
MLLHPFDHPVVLSRAWCLFEIYTAMLVGASVQMLFAPDDEVAFFAALKAGTFGAKAVCGKVDATEATATEPDDLEMILAAIKKKIGLPAYNAQLQQFLEGQYNLMAIRGWSK